MTTPSSSFTLLYEDPQFNHFHNLSQREHFHALHHNYDQYFKDYQSIVDTMEKAQLPAHYISPIKSLFGMSQLLLLTAFHINQEQAPSTPLSSINLLDCVYDRSHLLGVLLENLSTEELADLLCKAIRDSIKVEDDA